MNSYKGITFAKGYSKSFAKFKEEFGSTHVFNEIHPDERENELKVAHKIAIENRITQDDLVTPKSLKEIEVVDEKILQNDGNASATIDKSKETATKKTTR